MELTEEQQRQVEANRAAAIAKRKAFLESRAQQQEQSHREGENIPNPNPWHLFKCQKFPKPQPPKFLARLEICSPDSFSVTPMPLPPFPFPGHHHCLSTLNSILSQVLHFSHSHF